MSEPRFTITVTDMGGWARVYLASGEPAGEVAKPLSQSLTEWMRSNPQLRVTHIVPITSSGDTAELHVWYEKVPDSSVTAKPVNGN